jgi:hypothetical protein
MATELQPSTAIRGHIVIDQQYGIIAHLDVLSALDGEAKCRLVLVDLEAGRYAGDLCVAARDWEKRRDVFSIPTEDLTVSVLVLPPVTSGTSPSEEPAQDQETPPVPAAAPVPPVEVDPASTGGELDVDALRLRYRALPEWDRKAFRDLNIPPDDLTAIAAELDRLENLPTFVDQARQRMADDAERNNGVWCKSCGAPIRWAKTEAGKRIPLDPEPRPNGNLLVQDGIAYVHEPGDATDFDQQYYVSHFATCPNADSHRKRDTVDPEGGPVSLIDIAPLQNRWADLSPDADLWARSVVKAANTAGVDFRIQEHRTVRRYELYRGLINLAHYAVKDPDQADEVLRNLVHDVTGDDAVLFANVTAGHALGSLDAAGAARFALLVDQLVTV